MSLSQLDNVGDVIEKIRIGHDNKGMTPGWHLDRVEVRRLKEDGETSTTYTFPCKRWLAKDEDDGSVVRELIPSKVIEESVTEDGEFKTKELAQETLERKCALVGVKTQIRRTELCIIRVATVREWPGKIRIHQIREKSGNFILVQRKSQRCVLFWRRRL